MIRAIIFSLSLSFILISCSPQPDDLESVKAFEKNNKYFKAGLKSLHFIIETSPIEEVDSVFNAFVERHNIPVDAEGCADGIYTGRSPEDAYDYAHSVTIEIKNEKIISIDYNEIKEMNKGKEEDKAYNEEMSVTGTSPSIAYPMMENQMLDKQNMNSIDAVSGATYSLYRFRYAVMIALMKARIKNNSINQK